MSTKESFLDWKFSWRACVALLMVFFLGYWMGANGNHPEDPMLEPSTERITHPTPNINALTDSLSQELSGVPLNASEGVLETVSESNLDYTKPKYDMESVYWLALNIYFEARSQTKEGQIAVVYTTMERVRRPEYPNTVKGVVTQARRTSSGKLIKHKCQFSWYCDGKPDKIRDTKAWESSLALAARTLIEEPASPAKGATHYHASYVAPYWASKMQFLTQVDDHLFYKRTLK